MRTRTSRIRPRGPPAKPSRKERGYAAIRQRRPGELFCGGRRYSRLQRQTDGNGSAQYRRGAGFCPRDVNREGASRRCGALVVACSEAIRDADRAVQGADGAGAKDRNLKRRADNAQLWSSAATVPLNASLLTDG